MASRLLILGLLLVGCQSHQPIATPSPSGSRSATPSPAHSAGAAEEASATASPAAVEEITLEDALAASASYLHHGMTTQARMDMVLNHLNKAGRRSLVVKWEGYPRGKNLFDVSYCIEPFESLTQKPKVTTRKGDPFARPSREGRKGVFYDFLYDANVKVLKPENEAAEKLMALQPSLDWDGLNGSLPTTWKARPMQPSEVPTLTGGENSLVAEPVASATPSISQVQCSGFVGDGKDRRAVLNFEGQTYTLGAGQQLGPLRIKSVDDEEVVIQYGDEQVRLEAGQMWGPGAF
jgi:hypothetical protein